MSKGAKQAIFIALAAVVLVGVVYILTSNRTISSAPPSTQANQAEEIDPAIAQRIQTLESAFKSDPKNVATLTELGQLYFESGQLDLAAMMFKSGVEIAPNDPELHNYLGFVYFWSAKSKEAIAEFTKASELDPKASEYVYMLALAHYHGQPSNLPEATQNWKKVIELAPGSPLATKSQEYLDKTKGEAAIPTAAPALGKP